MLPMKGLQHTRPNSDVEDGMSCYFAIFWTCQPIIPVIHSAINPSWNANKSHRRRLYLLALGNELVEKHCLERNAPMLLPQPPSSSSSAKRGVCMICNGEKRRCTLRCSKCDKFACKEHSNVFCVNCVKFS